MVNKKHCSSIWVGKVLILQSQNCKASNTVVKDKPVNLPKSSPGYVGRSFNFGTVSKPIAEVHGRVAWREH